MKEFKPLNKIIYPVLTGLIVLLIMLITTTRSADASHDTIYTPCDTEYGFIHMTYEEWAAHIATMEADGTIPPGMVFRYWEELHGGKGGTVLEDGTIPAWDTWAYNLTDGQILSIDDWANGQHPAIEALMFSSGMIPEWILDANRTIRRFNDPYWAQPNPLTPTFTIWQSLCMAHYGYSLPVMEINDNGIWVTNIPTTTTTTMIPPTTTTQPAVEDPAPETNPPSDPEDADPSPQPSTVEGPDTETETSVPSLPQPTVPPDPSSPLSDYDLFDAEWDDYPFEKTILLLEERYPPGTPNKHHFRLSTAVEFLRNGGMIKGLDNLWDSPA